MTENDARQAVTICALSYEGAVQGDARHKQIVDTYNAFRPKSRSYKVTYTDAWCATFVSTVAILQEFADIIPPECSCGEMIDLFRKNAYSRWEENDAYVPQPGDIIMYWWADGATYEDNDAKGWPDHVGIVVSVVGRIITVIEGNYSKSVKRRNVVVNGRYIRGFCLPAYQIKATPGPIPEPEPTAPEKPKEDFIDMTPEEFYTDYFLPANNRFRRETALASPADWSEEARQWNEEAGLILGVTGKGDEEDMQYKTYANREMILVLFKRFYDYLKDIFEPKDGEPPASE